MAATKKLDLRTGRPVWQDRSRPRFALTPLAGNTSCDVLVIGAGISGAMVAEHLTERGYDVMLVDRRGPLKGSTPASTALLQYEIDESVTDLTGAIGKERAIRIWRRSKLALDALRERTRRLGIAADCVNRDGLFLEGDALDAKALRKEYEARREAGFEVSFLEKAEVKARFGIPGRTAILAYDNLAADPVRLAAGYLKTALSRGARLHAPHEIVTVEPEARSVQAITREGRIIRARHVVFATGYEMPKGVPAKGHRIISTFALATRPQKSRLWENDAFIWEASEPYLYLRVGPDNRVICGGEDEECADEAARDALLPEKIATIRKKLAKLIPGLDTTPEYRWCGSFGASPTGTPSIGRVPRMPNCYAVLGYGGNGITFSMMAAQMIAGMIDGVGDPDSDLFSFTRTF